MMARTEATTDEKVDVGFLDLPRIELGGDVLETTDRFFRRHSVGRRHRVSKRRMCWRRIQPLAHGVASRRLRKRGFCSAVRRAEERQGH